MHLYYYFKICLAFGFAQVVSYFYLCDGHGIFETNLEGKIHFKNLPRQLYNLLFLQLILRHLQTGEAVQEMAVTKVKAMNFLCNQTLTDQTLSQFPATYSLAVCLLTGDIRHDPPTIKTIKVPMKRKFVLCYLKELSKR